LSMSVGCSDGFVGFPAFCAQVAMLLPRKGSS
jgi:hypothetical protein